jgi:hypothetical protein
MTSANQSHSKTQNTSGPPKPNPARGPLAQRPPTTHPWNVQHPTDYATRQLDRRTTPNIQMVRAPQPPISNPDAQPHINTTYKKVRSPQQPQRLPRIPRQRQELRRTMAPLSQHSPLRRRLHPQGLQRNHPASHNAAIPPTNNHPPTANRNSRRLHRASPPIPASTPSSTNNARSRFHNPSRNRGKQRLHSGTNTWTSKHQSPPPEHRVGHHGQH